MLMFAFLANETKTLNKPLCGDKTPSKHTMRQTFVANMSGPMPIHNGWGPTRRRRARPAIRRRTRADASANGVCHHWAPRAGGNMARDHASTPCSIVQRKKRNRKILRLANRNPGRRQSNGRLGNFLRWPRQSNGRPGILCIRSLLSDGAKDHPDGTATCAGATACVGTPAWTCGSALCATHTLESASLPDAPAFVLPSPTCCDASTGSPRAPSTSSPLLCELVGEMRLKTFPRNANDTIHDRTSE